ncbi:hypothetical protein ZHAS_00005299 [Anopheles sinensis]|uniref:Uncharacterized protein n=1 Tax=Anopheles sinensis TaxID=74873 RepID=A0A084VJ87_ANOSI|nr:hypothetical protein ZHAS_00005299 [Anopheles sinensis]
MATITTITKSGPNTPTPAVPTTAQFKSHVYSKYRELLGSYNDKANEILHTYPAYRVQEDHGFALRGDNYGGPPQSTIGNSARRIQAQLPAEPPACVQNAMMRRDKQPFTYTPGGIDLSQIKSPRMAKRISRNANSEGVTGQPKVSPLAQNNGSNHSSNGSSNGSHNPVSPAATLGAAAMGMPFQVFPTGPPAPPPPPPPTGRVVPGANGAGTSKPMPPPPPPPGPAEVRKSPRPQVFEAPPMGMRPEIKIPPNPMANLRKAPRPQPKNDFWIEEYRREKQQDSGPPIPRPVPPPSYSYTSRDLDDEVAKNTLNRTDGLTVRGDPQKRSPSPSNLTKPRENGSASTSSIKTPPVYGQSPVPPNLPPPITPTKVSTSLTPNTKVSPPPVRPKPSLSPVSNTSTNSYTGPSSSSSPSVTSSAPTVAPPSVGAQRPAAQALGSLYIPPIHEVFANSKQSLLTQASPPWMSSRHNSLKEQPEWVHRDDQESQPGATTSSTERTPPPQEKEQQTVTSTSNNNNNNNNKNKEPQALRGAAATGKSESETTKSVDSIVTAPSQVSARPSPPSSKQLTQNSTTVTMPVSRGYPQQGSVYAQAQPVYSPQPAAGSQKERIIPIQIEKSPVQSPATASSFAPPPYYSPAPQYGPTSANSASSIQSPVPIGFATPHSGFTTPTAMFTNPNHFVNQGYNNISYPPTPTAQPQPHPMYQHHQHYAPPQTPPLHHHPMHPQPPPPAQQQRMQQQNSATNVRIVPIKVEGAEHTARGPLSNTPAIIQSDPRSSNNTQAWNGNNAPNQSRSFRVLQQITDTLDESETGKGAKESNSEVAGHDQADGRNVAHQPESADGQMRRLQLSNEDKALMNRVKTQVDGEVYLHNEEDPRYRGAAIPSKAFRYLQNMTDSGQAANQSNTGSGNRTQQMFNRGNNNETDGESPVQYVPPSEQKVEEPKKYTGGSIPSRSFRMLQAMTGSDAPVDPNSSDSEGGSSVKLPHCSGTDIRYSPYPYPHPQPYYCCNPNWHYYDPSTNPQYYPPPPPPPPHAPGYYYPPPPPPPGHYDRAGGFYGGYMSPHHFYYAPEPCSPCTPPPYYQLSQPQTAYCESLPGEAIHTYVITTPPPRIVVTPTPGDTGDSCSDSELQQQHRREQLGELHDVVGEFVSEGHQQRHHPHPLTRSQSSLKRLSERLSNFNHGGSSPCEAEAKSSPSSVRCSPCSPLNERYRTYEESTSSVPSSQSEASDSEDEGSAPARRKKGSIVEYANGVARNENTSPSQKKHTDKDEQHPVGKDKQEEEEEEEDGEEEEDEEDDDEEEEEEVESEDDETVGYGGSDGPVPAEEHLPHQLSVIFEEESVYQSTVASRRASVCSNSSTLSDCSSTLANDLDEDEDTEGKPSGNRTDDDIDRLEEADMERSLVSVRLPLKLSFSKSPNNEDIATLVVGESEITGSSETLSGTTKRFPNNATEEDSGDESDTEEDDASESETDTATDEEDSTAEAPKAAVGTEDHEADTDVTVTITIPSLTSKAKAEDRGVDRAQGVKQNEPVKTPFKIDYEETSEVSVSVSLPLKSKSGSSTSEIPKESTPVDKPPTEGGNNDDSKPEDEEEEVDFWSQIGDGEEDYQRPMRSFSRDMWSSREFSVDRQSVWSQDDEEATTTATTDFWSAENGPTEASDMWKLDKLQPSGVSQALANGEDEAKRDSLEYWQKENERLVKDLYEARNGQGALDTKDENNNKPRMALDGSQGDRKTEEHSEEELEEQSESEDNSEEYETSNTSKEESEVEQEPDDAVKESSGIRKEIVPPMSESKVNELTPGAGANEKLDKDKKLSVKERISLFETQRNVPSPCGGDTLQVNGGTMRSPSQNSRLRPLSRQKMSCDESEAEDDSGVTSDMSKHISEVETDSECFPEMRKMTRYQRAATHSRLFKLLQDESNNGDSEDEEASEDISKEMCKEEKQEKKHQQHPRSRKPESEEISPPPQTAVVRANMPGKATQGDESAEGRRDRLTLPICQQSSSGNDSLSSSGSSASPVSGTLQNEKLAEELVQSLLMKKKGRLFRNLPLEKLHAAALKILQEDLESNGTLSSTEDNLATVDSTPALTPQEFKSEYPSSYADYYDTWCNEAAGQQLPNGCYSDTGSDSGMVKVFRTVPEHQLSSLGRKDTSRSIGATTPNGHWSPRCPRVFSNKNVPRLAEVRESEPAGLESPRGSRPPSRASNNRSPFPSTMDDYTNQRNTANRQFKLQ